jgi:hypothetical protein
MCFLEMILPGQASTDAPRAVGAGDKPFYSMRGESADCFHIPLIAA